MHEISIRTARETDAAAIAAIYAPYVRDTAITYEIIVPTEREMAMRVRETLTRYPFLVAQRGEDILGYAYAGAFSQRAAYQHSAETTVYLAMESRGQGIGKRLYEALEEILRRQGVLNLYAKIANAKGEDVFLPQGSLAFHRKQGFHPAGQFTQCANKFGRWYDMVYMEKSIGEHGEQPPAFVPFSALTPPC
jgi:phosphinothricin acetyltransferase